MRDEPSSDLFVFGQLFLQEEYKSTVKLCNKYFPDNRDLILIDAGANIGMTTLYLSNFFNFSKIIVIEPSIENLEILNLNCDKLLTRSNKILTEI